MVTLAVRLRRTRPEPLQDAQGSEMVCPVPPQVGQVRTDTMNPPPERTWPVPLQVAQVTGWVPSLAPVPWQVSQSSLRMNSKDFDAPKAASSNSMRMLTKMSRPRIGALRRDWVRAPPMPPKSWSKMDSKPPNPPPSKPPNPPIGGPSMPNWS